jgi:hypothetical protein
MIFLKIVEALASLSFAQLLLANCFMQTLLTLASLILDDFLTSARNRSFLELWY